MIHILTLPDGVNIFYFGNLNTNIEYINKLSFCQPDIDHKNYKVINVSNSISEDHRVANIVVNNKDLATREIKYFPEYQSPFNLERITIYLGPSGFTLKKNHLTSQVIDMWVNRNPKQLRLFPLSVIIWPPAFHLSSQILNDLNKHYIVVQDKPFKLPNNMVSNFVYDAYRDDVRCDKSKLKYKLINFKKHTMRFRYLKILVKKPVLNKDNISETSIAIKKNIRSKYKKYVKDYIYDVILHVADNKKHTKSMNDMTQKYLKKLYLT